MNGSMLLFDTLLDALAVILSISLLMTFVRLYIGPGAPDRTVAFDLIAVHVVGIIALAAIRTRSDVLLDAAIITAVLGFLGTVMLAQFVEQSDSDDLG